MADTPITAEEIRDGIEWFKAEDREWEAQCGRCGSSVGFLACCHCGGDGCVEVEDWEDCGYTDTDETCDFCKGTGGEWHCISTPDYCTANPIAGREHIESTAMKSEAWND